MTTDETTRRFARPVMKRILVGLALTLSAGALAPSVFGQTREAPDSAREQPAVHACSARAGKYSNTTEHTMRYYAWRGCMGENGFMNE
jgi:hypothetical protein